MKKFYISLFTLASTATFAQQENSSFTNTGRGCATTFATDYQTVGINPANLGWDWKYSDKKFALGFVETAASLHSDSLNKSDLRNVINAAISGHSSDFTYDQKKRAGQNFAEGGFAVNVDVGTFGAALTTKKAGGFAFRINDHFQFFCQLGSTASNLLFQGKTSNIFDSLTITTANGQSYNIHNHPNLPADTANMVSQGFSSNAPKLISQVLNNTHMTMMWTRDYNLSYGKKLFGDSTFAMFAGIGAKYVQGLALLDIEDKNNHLSSYSSLSPAFNIQYGQAAADAHAVIGSGFPPKTVGNGFGMDFGLNAIIANKLKLGVALINVGSITWKGNVYSLKDTFVVKTQNAGLNNYNILNQLGTAFGNNGSLFKLEGQKSIVTQLPGVFRAGASLMLHRKFEVGVDMIVPVVSYQVPGSFKDPVLSFGLDWMPVRWLKLQGGFVHGGNYGNQVPIGIIFVTGGGTYEAGIASRDAVIFFTHNGPTLSISTGFLRFRF